MSKNITMTKKQKKQQKNIIHIIGMKWIEPKIISKRIEDKTLILKIDWSGGNGTNICISEIKKNEKGFQYKDDSIKLLKEFETIEKLLWEFEFPKSLEVELNKI